MCSAVAIECTDRHTKSAKEVRLTMLLSGSFSSLSLVRVVRSLSLQARNLQKFWMVNTMLTIAERMNT